MSLIVGMNNFLNHLEKKYPKGEWKLDISNQRYGYYRYENQWSFENDKLGIHFCVFLLKKSPTLRIDFYRRTKAKELYNLFVSYLKDNKLDYLINTFDNSSLDFAYTGVKSEALSSILSCIKANTFYWDGAISIKDKRVDYSFDITIDPDYHFVTLKKIKNRKYIDSFILKTKEDGIRFATEQENYTKELLEKEKEFVDLIHKYDKTAYFKHDNLVYFIYGSSYALYIKKIKTEAGNISYKGKVDFKYIQSKDLDSLVEKMKEQVKKHCIKNRVNATVSGKTTNFIDTFLYDIYGKRKVCYQYSKMFDSPISEGEFNIFLKDKIDMVEKKPLTKMEIQSFQEKLVSEKKRNRIKFGYKYDELYVLISGSKVHIYKESVLN